MTYQFWHQRLQHLYYVPDNNWTEFWHQRLQHLYNTCTMYTCTCTMYLVTTEQSSDIRGYNTCTTYLVTIEHSWHQRLQHLYFVPGNDWTEFHIKDYNTWTTYLVSIELEVCVANVEVLGSESIWLHLNFCTSDLQCNKHTCNTLITPTVLSTNSWFWQALLETNFQNKISCPFILMTRIIS